MADGTQSSSSSDNRKIADRMLQGVDQITAVKNTAKEQASALSSAYQGEDGAAFQKVLADWDASVQKVVNGLRTVANNMVDTHDAGQRKMVSDVTSSIRSHGAKSDLIGR
ncbi:WXG100 family type VII secretion target [Streptomyces sp. NPDC035033]|uniref:WXG100 family type VII secretion target n=1 Tax=Streptomyces sp. NPDC035033 TaxID=3155368 RepID=UPI00340571B5